MSEPACSGMALGVIGAGRLGLAVARLALGAGMTVRVAGSGAPVRTRQVVAMFAPGAETVAAEDLVDVGTVVLAMPLSAIDDLDPGMLEGSVVIDAMNYWPETDGMRPEFDDPTRPTSTLVAARLAGAQVVKALNHVAFRDLEAGAKPVGSPYRIGIGIAGSGEALERVAVVVRCLGFDPVPVGSLAESGVLEPRGPVFGAAVPAEQLRARIDAAQGRIASGDG
ncbi:MULTISPECIES: NADPH-dependent F420 reductase [Microbacterium]|uniref:NADPH-dependent F420 reductase n=1 Tax=Microbacterium TaxID=33882 RepID=UPI001E2D77EA|nr:NAD(P)-binding domain-containing protein [Microbacterium nymphoidis]MCD2498946.1 NAD(P)-binding domain-containing protein [Microbacterium nymphoidis]